jgi:hypothetical protein
MDANRENDFVYEVDGDQWCCHRQDFTNLQESLAGFGNTQEEALADLLKQENP